MKTNEANIEPQVSLWTVVCPALAIATAITLLLKGTAINFYLAILFLCGVIVCWRWHARGLLASITALVLFETYAFLVLPASERLWQLGMGLAMGTSFFVISMTFEEIQSLISGVEREATSRLKRVLQLDLQLEAFHARIEHETKAAQIKIKDQSEEIQVYKRLLEDARNDLLITHEQQEKLMQELIQSRQELSKLHEQLEEGMSSKERVEHVLVQKDKEIEQLWKEMQAAEEQILTLKTHGPSDMADPVARKWEGMYKQLRQQFEDKSRMVDEARKQLFQAEERLAAYEHEKEAKELAISDIEIDLQNALTHLESDKDQLEREVNHLHQLVGYLMLTHSNPSDRA